MKEILIALITYSSWPFFLCIVFYLLKDQIQFFLSRLTTLKAGSLEFQLLDQLTEQEINHDVLVNLTELSVDELDLFLLVSFSESVGFAYTTVLPSHIFYKRMKALEKAGLIVIVNPENDGSDIKQDLTDLGKQIRSILLNNSARVLRNAAKQKA